MEIEKMRLQFQILFYFLCLNIAVMLITGLNLAGTEYVKPQTILNATDFESTYNASTFENWEPSVWDVVSTIFSGFQYFFTHIHWLIIGFPLFLYSMGNTYITDASALGAYNILVGALVALFLFLMSFWFIEYIGGRYFTE